MATPMPNANIARPIGLVISVPRNEVVGREDRLFSSPERQS